MNEREASRTLLQYGLTIQKEFEYGAVFMFYDDEENTYFVVKDCHLVLGDRIDIQGQDFNEIYDEFLNLTGMTEREKIDWQRDGF